MSRLNSPNHTKIAQQIEKLPCSDELKDAVSQLVSAVVSEITGSSFVLAKKVTAREIRAGARFISPGQLEPHLTLINVTSNHAHFKSDVDSNRTDLWLLGGLGGDPHRTYSNGPFTTESLVEYINSRHYRLA